MASFDENGKYIKTNWKAGDKITATKLNKIEESIEAVNDNDISRHVEADARLDALEAKDVAHDKELTNIKNTIADNKAAAELGDYDINSRMQFLEDELEEAVAEVNNVAETVDGKIATAEANMAAQVDQGKVDMEAMVAEVEADLEGLHAKDEELSEQLAQIKEKIIKTYVIPDDFENWETMVNYCLENNCIIKIPAKEYVLKNAIALKGVSITGEDKYKSKIIGQLSLGSNSNVSNVYLEGQFLFNDSLVENINIDNCMLNGCTTNDMIGIDDRKARNITITNTEFFNCKHGILLVNKGLKEVCIHDITVLNCKFYDNADMNMEILGRAYGNDCDKGFENLTVKNCDFIGYAGSEVSDRHINVSLGGQDISKFVEDIDRSIPPNKNVLFEGCNFVDGFYCFENVGFGNVRINNCTFKNTVTTNSNVISSSMFNTASDTGISNFIIENSYFDITEKVYEDNTNIYPVMISINGHNAILRNNIFKNSQVRLFNADNCKIVNNTFEVIDKKQENKRNIVCITTDLVNKENKLIVENNEFILDSKQNTCISGSLNDNMILFMKNNKIDVNYKNYKNQTDQLIYFLNTKAKVISENNKDQFNSEIFPILKQSGAFSFYSKKYMNLTSNGITITSKNLSKFGNMPYTVIKFLGAYTTSRTEPRSLEFVIAFGSTLTDVFTDVDISGKDAGLVSAVVTGEKIDNAIVSTNIKLNFSSEINFSVASLCELTILTEGIDMFDITNA